MIICWDDREWPWDPEAITVAMARQIRDFTGRGLRSWMHGLSDGEPDSLIALWWAVQHQNGVASTIEQIEIPVPKFYRAVEAASVAELQRRAEQAAQEPKAPKGAGRTRKRTPTSAGTGTDTSFS